MDGWMDGWMDMDGWTDGRTDGWMDDGQIDTIQHEKISSKSPQEHKKCDHITTTSPNITSNKSLNRCGSIFHNYPIKAQ